MPYDYFNEPLGEPQYQPNFDWEKALSDVPALGPSSGLAPWEESLAFGGGQPGGAGSTAPVSPSFSGITNEDISKMMSDYQTGLMRNIRDVSGTFGGPSLSDVQQLQNILHPRTAIVGQAPSIDPMEQIALEVNKARQMGNLQLEMKRKLFEQIFGGGSDPLMSRILRSVTGLFPGQTAGLPPTGAMPVGDIVRAMEALNASNAQKQQEALSRRFASLGRSPASTVMGDLLNRISESQSLANIQGAGEIERLMLPISQQREQIAADLQRQREQMMSTFITNLLGQVMGGSFGLAGM